MTRIPVRFMKNGGEGGNTKKENKSNIISTRYGDINVDDFKAFISDPRNIESIYDKYKGFEGQKIRAAVTSRLNEMAQSFISGKMKFDDDIINRYISANESFRSDGKTKKRIFTGNYSHKDQNTVNSLAARVMLDVMNDNIKTNLAKKAEAENQAKLEEEKKAKLPEYNPETTLWDSRMDSKDIILSGDIDGNRKDMLAMIKREQEKLNDESFSSKYTPESVARAKKQYEDWANYISDDRILSDQEYQRTFKINNPNLYRMLTYTKSTEPGTDDNGLSEDEKKLIELEKKAKQSENERRIQGYIDNEKSIIANNQRAADRKAWEQIYLNGAAYTGPDALYNIVNDPSTGTSWTNTYNNIRYNLSNDEYREKFTKAVNDYYNGNQNAFAEFSINGIIPTINDMYRHFDDVYGNNGVYAISYPDKDENIMVYDRSNGNRRVMKMTIPQAIRYGVFPGAQKEAMLTKKFDTLFPVEKYVVNDDFVVESSPYLDFVKQNQKEQNEKITESKRNGGIVKMQDGGTVDYSQIYRLGRNLTPSGTNYNEFYTDEENKAYSEFFERHERNKANLQFQTDYANRRSGYDKEGTEYAFKTSSLEDEDVFRGLSAIANIASSVAAVTGFTPASTTLGVVGTGLNLIGDLSDDSLSNWQKFKNTATNLGLDLVSLIPYAGVAANASKTAKALKSASRLIGLASSYLALQGLGEDVRITMNAFENKDFKDFNNQDITALMNIFNTLAKGLATGKNVWAGHKMTKAMKGGEKQYAVRVSSKNLSGKKNKVVLSENELKELNNMRFENGNPSGKLIGNDEAVKAQKEFIMSKFDVNENDLDFNTPIKFTNESKGLFKGTRNSLGTSGRVYERNSFSPLNNPNNTGKYGLKTGDSWMGRFNANPFLFGGYNPTDMSRHTRKDYVRRQVDTPPANNTGSTVTQTTGTTQTHVSVDNPVVTPVVGQQPNMTQQDVPMNDIYFRKGGTIKRVKLKNGGYVYKLQDGGGQWANNRPRGTYYDDGASYFDIWNNTTGKALIDRLSKMLELKKAGKIEEWNAARKGIMGSSRDIQSSYKGMNKETGWGFNNTGYTPEADITKQHQGAFDKDFRSANENIWAYQGIHRRGNTGDNESSANKTDGINSVYTSMRTYGYTNDNQDEFENSETVKKIQELARLNGLVYEPWKDIAEGKENWYVFNDMGNTEKLNAKPLEAPKPNLNAHLKFDAKIHKPGVGAPVKTDPASLENDNDGGKAYGDNIMNGLLSGAILAGTLNANKKAFYKLDTPLLSHPLYNAKTYDGYYEKNAAENAANKTRLAARRFGSETADIDRYIAGALAGESHASDIERQAAVESARKYDETKEKAINTFNTNATVSSDTFNKNIASIVGTRNADKQLKGNYITSQWEGAWKPFLNEIKGNMMRRQREKMYFDNERFMKTDYADFLNDSWNRAYDEAKITDPDNRNQQYLFANNRDIFDKYSRINTNYYYQNAPIYRTPIMYRNGGTVRVTRKIDNDSFMKEFGKNDRESKKDFSKRFVTLSQGALTLHSASRKDRLDLYKYLKNLK